MKHKIPLHPLRAVSDNVRLTVKDGERIVIFAYDERPSVIPNNLIGQGTYDFSGETMRDGKFPFAIGVADLAALRAIEKITAQTVNATLDAMSVAKDTPQ